jgi:subtilase family serine protease
MSRNAVSRARSIKSRLAGTAGALALAVAIFAPGADAAAGSVKIAGNHPAEAVDIAAQGNVAPDRLLTMEITLALRNRAELDRLLAAQQDPSSPQYHQWLTPDEFNARFGPTDADAQAISKWLEGNGFTVDAIGAGNRSIEFHSSAAIAERAFGVHIAATSDKRNFANIDDPALPADIAPLVGAINGLANIRHPISMAAGTVLQPARPGDLSPDVSIGQIHHRFGPNDLYTFYDYTPLGNAGIDGTGTDCIALIEDSDFDTGSVNLFDSQFGLPTVSASTVEADGVPAGINGDYVETELDVQYAHAAAPGAPIVAYVGNENFASANGGVADALSRAVSDNTCGAISISFSFCGGASTFFTSTLDGLFAQAASQGQAVFASSGDQGAAGIAYSASLGGCAVSKTRTVSELSADPAVTAVGGTAFSPKYTKAGDDIGFKREHVWHDKTGASGGGESALFAKPSYQSSVIAADANRDVPDISFAASPLHPGFFFAYQGQMVCCIGGTSLSSPYWAGIAQLVADQASETRTGNLNARLYTLGALADPTVSGLRDVTRGRNSFHHVAGFKATEGYDKATGWGTPDISILVPALAGP